MVLINATNLAKILDNTHFPQEILSLLTIYDKYPVITTNNVNYRGEKFVFTWRRYYICTPFMTC